jgi:D-glycero-alpha-D-manno-heptose-7-phosphate kinase
LHALLAYRGKYIDAAALGASACRIEIELCSEPIGKQDQYAAAFGGLNLIEFLPDETVKVSPIICAPETCSILQREMLMLYTGITRSASSLLREQSQSIRSNPNTRATMKQMRDLAYAFQIELSKGNTDVVGEILHENWLLKKSLTPGISSDHIDEWYAKARANGATGGKILGAGAGGFLMLTAPESAHGAICRALPGLRRMPTKFERFGSQIVFYNPPPASDGETE